MVKALKPREVSNLTHLQLVRLLEQIILERVCELLGFQQESQTGETFVKDRERFYLKEWQQVKM